MRNIFPRLHLSMLAGLRIMGRGIALQFRNAYPENFKAARYCVTNRKRS